MAQDDLGEIFDGLFGKDKRTDEQREADERQDLCRKNDNYQLAFEKERDRRANYLAMDQRIRNIASQEISKLVVAGVTGIVIYQSVKEYGLFAGGAILALALGIWWWNEKQTEKSPKFKIEEVDDLAEDTVTHERIVEMAEANQDWITVKGEYLYWDDMFSHPYWEQVSKKVHKYVQMPHATRLDDNAAAQAKSRPYRVAMNKKLKSIDEEWELPYWARIRGE